MGANGRTTLAQLRATSGDDRLPSYAWPGGYQIVYYTDDGSTLCSKCANDGTTSQPATAWDIFYEGPPMPCDDCGEIIESAYGDPDAEDEPAPEEEAAAK